MRARGGRCAFPRVLRWRIVYMDVLRGLQEGWMEMPELFGNPYVLPAVIVVVLLLVLLLILMMRKRRDTSRSEVRSMERVATPPGGPASATGPRQRTTAAAGPTATAAPTATAGFTGAAGPIAAAAVMPVAAADSQPGPVPSQTTEAPDISLAPQPQSPPAVVQPAVAKERAAPVTPVAKASKLPAPAAPDDDPLRAVILDIVHGMGRPDQRGHQPPQPVPGGQGLGCGRGNRPPEGRRGRRLRPHASPADTQVRGRQTTPAEAPRSRT